MDALHEEALKEDHLHTGRQIAGRALCNLFHAGSYDSEDLYDYDTDEHRPGRLKIDCPSCARTIKPLLSKTHLFLKSDWRWAGLEYQEPYSNHMSVCPGCHNPVLFTLYTCL